VKAALRSITSALLLLTFLSLGTGTLEYLHDLQHEYEDHLVELAALKQGKKSPVAPIHDESNCFVHAQLHIATLPTGCVPLLILLGLLVAFLTLITSPLVSRRQLFRIDCRGPPIALPAV
jgi:hypothetical protein